MENTSTSDLVDKVEQLSAENRNLNKKIEDLTNKLYEKDKYLKIYNVILNYIVKKRKTNELVKCYKKIFIFQGHVHALIQAHETASSLQRKITFAINNALGAYFGNIDDCAKYQNFVTVNPPVYNTLGTYYFTTKNNIALKTKQISTHHEFSVIVKESSFNLSDSLMGICHFEANQ